MLVARYFLLLACYFLLLACYFLLVARYFLLVIRYFLLVYSLQKLTSNEQRAKSFTSKSFGNLRNYLLTKLFILDIRFHFTCGEPNLILPFLAMWLFCEIFRADIFRNSRTNCFSSIYTYYLFIGQHLYLKRQAYFLYVFMLTQYMGNRFVHCLPFKVTVTYYVNVFKVVVDLYCFQ